MCALFLFLFHFCPPPNLKPNEPSSTEDDALGAQLLSSPKDRAEHIMLVDLARNDVNRVCPPASVKVDQLMAVQKFSHVIHLTSQVTGVLRGDKNRCVFVLLIRRDLFWTRWRSLVAFSIWFPSLSLSCFGSIPRVLYFHLAFRFVLVVSHLSHL